ncbi:MAG: hypothetical protein PHN88_09090 [Ignavibacteria bacterium]|nr:hypothetical protein [Ignavibacteria bacterium]
MTLSEKQKKYVNQLLLGEITDIFSFIGKNIELEEAKEKSDYDSLVYRIKTGWGKPFLIKDVEDVYNSLLNFLVLIEMLEKKGLVFIRNLNDKYDISFQTISIVHADKILLINSLIKDYEYRLIFPTPELFDFARRGFISQDEYFSIEENKDRKKAQKLTLIIAIASIIFGCITTSFQYFTYSKEREVIISKNKDTSKIIITEPVKIYKDSTNQ